MVVSTTKVSNTSKTRVLQLKQLIHTLQKPVHARQKVDHSKSHQFNQQKDAQVYKEQLHQDQLVSQLMLQIGVDTALVFSVDVVQTLTMTSC